MAKLKIKGWDTGVNKKRMTEILIEKLMLTEDQSDELLDAVSAGQTISLDIEDDALADDLRNELSEVGALIDLE